jgi:hypothetical protein
MNLNESHKFSDITGTMFTRGIHIPTKSNQRCGEDAVRIGFGHADPDGPNINP